MHLVNRIAIIALALAGLFLTVGFAAPAAHAQSGAVASLPVTLPANSPASLVSPNAEDSIPDALTPATDPNANRDAAFCSDLHSYTRLEMKVNDPTGAATNLQHSEYERRFRVQLEQLPDVLERRYRRLLLDRSVDPRIARNIFRAQPDYRIVPACAGAVLANDGFTPISVPDTCVREVLAPFLKNLTYRRFEETYFPDLSTPAGRARAAATLELLNVPAIESIERAALVRLTRPLSPRAIRDRIAGTEDANVDLFRKKAPVFDRVLDLMRSKVRLDLAKNPAARANFLERLDLVQFGGFDCATVSRVDLSQSLKFSFFRETATDGRQIIRFCPGALRWNQSEYSWVWFLAHEMAHVIGPCEYQRLPSGDASGKRNLALEYGELLTRGEMLERHPYGAVLTCLSDTASDDHGRVGPAARFTDSDRYDSNGRYVNGTPAFCSTDGASRGDQIDETFSDWMATEVLGEYVARYFGDQSALDRRNGISNVFRGIGPFVWSGDLTSKATATYLSAEDRINRILFAQPKLRCAVQCGPGVTPYPFRHCHLPDAKPESENCSE